MATSLVGVTKVAGVTGVIVSQESFERGSLGYPSGVGCLISTVGSQLVSLNRSNNLFHNLGISRLSSNSL